MQVRDILKSKKQPVTINADVSIEKAIELLVEHKIGSLLVTDSSGQVTGIITERDIFQMTSKHCVDFKNIVVSDYMSKKLVIGVPDDDISYIAQIITQNRIRHIPIMDENKKLCGIVSIGDIVKAQLDLAEVHVRYLTEYITSLPSSK